MKLWVTSPSVWACRCPSSPKRRNAIASSVLGDDALPRALAGAVVEAASSRFGYTRVTTRLVLPSRDARFLSEDIVTGDLLGDSTLMAALLAPPTFRWRTSGMPSRFLSEPVMYVSTLPSPLASTPTEATGVVSASPCALCSLLLAKKYAAAASTAIPESPFAVAVGAGVYLAADAGVSEGNLGNEELDCKGGNAKEGDETTPLVTGRPSPLETVRWCMRRSP
mmetsp:Transcript_11267/g.18506  ORF Transcript_11267/g.18506 Transcript_11267/m.18506 type:complete len:223 (-) Transcript_11267:203-871(-)